MRAAVIDALTGELIERVVSPLTERVVDFVDEIAAGHGPVVVTYEAGPTGYGLARALQAAGHVCQIAAPSKLLRPSGDRVKTDRRDALLLARLARNGDIVAVTIATLAQESARDLVRAREDTRTVLMAARHRLSKLLLRHGHIYDNDAWTGRHDAWLRRVRKEHLLPTGGGVLIAFDDAYDAVAHALARRNRLDTEIA
ncbi:IS110 family transposase, partial [Nakamurella alba]|uniref:IS110 family transposase n=1 Tax=Nakamurella alba TaxID=2665158 RepID=UPI0018A98E3A